MWAAGYGGSGAGPQNWVFSVFSLLEKVRCMTLSRARRQQVSDSGATCARRRLVQKGPCCSHAPRTRRPAPPVYYKGHNSRTARWKRCTGQGQGKAEELPCPLACTLPTSARVHQPRHSLNPVLWVFMEDPYIGATD